VIARIAPSRTSPDVLEPLVEEIVAVARARSRWPVEKPNRRAEFFLLNTSSGDGLSVVIGVDRTVTPAIELGRPPSEDPEEYDVHLLQVGGPRASGRVEGLFGLLVRCDAGSANDSFNGAAVPPSQHVWARALLLARDGRLLVLAVGADSAALQDSLQKFSARCRQVEAFDEVPCHFFVH
jgi:hypothetical protein